MTFYLLNNDFDKLIFFFLSVNYKNHFIFVIVLSNFSLCKVFSSIFSLVKGVLHNDIDDCQKQSKNFLLGVNIPW